MLMPSALKYVTNKLIKAEMLPTTGHGIRCKITKVFDRDFTDNNGDTVIKIVLETDYEGFCVVLNQTRLWAMITAFGENYDLWVGESIILKQGSTNFGGKMVAAIVLIPVVRDKLAAEQHRAALEAPAPTGPEPEADYGEEAEDYVESKRSLAEELGDNVPF
jgi:hypothetical protein